MRGKILTFIVFLGIFLAIFVKINLFLDPDFGWHLQTGNLILSSGIPRTDPFSYTMPNFPYVDHAWLTDVFIAKLFPVIGIGGLALMVSAVIIGAVLITRGNLVINILALCILFSFSSVRPQVISWLFFAFLIYLIFNPNQFKKWRLIVPGIFFIWANLHGGFTAGLILLAFFDFPIFLVSLLATLLNPYVFGLWREIWSTLTDVSLHSTIGEWQPIYFFLHPAFIFLFLLCTATIIRYWKKFTPSQLLIFTFFSVAIFTAVRNITIWVFVAGAVASQGIQFLTKEIIDKESKKRLDLAIKFVLTLSVIFFIFSALFTFSDKSLLVDGRFYPKQAVSYLKINLPEKNIFSPYGWGGYLIWKLPEKKVFVDGRMPSWRQDNYSAFEEYNKILSGKIDYKPIFSKYNINTVLWSAPSEQTSLFDPIQLKVNKIFNIKPPEPDLLVRLKTDGWQKIYQDQTAVIYQKPGA